MSCPRWFARGLLGAAVLLLLSAATFSAPSAGSQRARKDIADAVVKLGSADPAERDEASKTLWSIGEPAKPALQETAAGDDLEAARRATEILRQIRYGIRPDTPAVVTELLSQYRMAAAPGSRQPVAPAVAGLSNAGPAGMRVLTRLWQDETDNERKKALVEALAEKSRVAAQMLFADGDGASAAELLDAAADAASPWGEPAVRDFAAVLLLRNGGAGLDERVAALKPVVADGAVDPAVRARSARLLAYLCRARGDLPAARWAAERSGEASLLELLLVESADWKELAARSDAKPNIDDSIEDLGFAAAYHRLAGDAAGLEKFAAKTVALAERRPDEAMLAAESLFLNDRPDAGVDILLKHKAYAEVSELLAPRMKFDELIALAARLRDEKEPDAAEVEARAAVAQHVLGDSKGGGETLERLVSEAAAGNSGAQELDRYAALAEAANTVGRADLAEECAARGVALARQPEDLAELLESAGFGPGERAARWWRVLRDKYKEPVRVTFGRLRSLLKGELAAGQVQSLARAAAAVLRARDPSHVEAALADIGDTLAAAGQKQAAADYFRWLTERPPPAPIGFIRLADVEADAGRWDAAAALYARAWELDRSQSLPLLLRGRALGHIGRESEGKDLVETAHLLPLADEAARHGLMLELERRQLRDDARRERDLILRTSAFQSWHQSDALRRAGDEAYEREDYLAAAGLWDRAFLDNQSRSTRFARLWANFAMPALIHRSRALGLIRSGDFAAAAPEAELAMHFSPSDADALIAVVNELDRLKRKPEADAFYKKHSAPYRALCAAHPDSAQAHNQLAWAEAKCDRDLDDALAHATRAVELDPKNAACIDTLAETHFVRGEVQKAIEAMNRCVELEPSDKHHQEQLERFNKALRGDKS